MSDSSVRPARAPMFLLASVRSLWYLEATAVFVALLGLALLYHEISDKKRVVKIVQENVPADIHSGRKGGFPPVEPLHGFDWKKTEPLKFRPFRPKYNITMALEKSSVSEIIQIDKDYFSRIALRKEIIAAHPTTSVRATAAVHPAVNELYTFLLGIHLPTRFPTLFQLSTESNSLLNLVSGKTYPVTPPASATGTLQTLGGLVDEDFMLLLPSADGDGYSLQGYVACFASGFGMEKIFGAKLRDIHAEVPGYKEKLQCSMDRWFFKLESGRYMKRSNWTITTHGNLRNNEGENQLYNPLAFSSSSTLDISRAHLRNEFQHFHRLPSSRAIVFSYKTYLYPIAEVKAEEGGKMAAVLADAIEGLGRGNCPEMRQYKGAVRWGEAIVRYLRS